MADLAPRLRAVCDLMQSWVQEGAGLHEYDGTIQDLSPAGVKAALGRLGGAPLSDLHDEAHLTAFEEGLRWSFGEYQWHRRNPLMHVGGLDLACYDRDYAPEQERAEARLRHLRAWPDAVDAAVEALDQVSAPVAQACRGAAAGLLQALSEDDKAAAPESVKAHERFMAHVDSCAAEGDADTSIGADALAREMGVWEALEVDLTVLATQAEREQERLLQRLKESVGQWAPGRDVAEVIQELAADHPTIDGVVSTAQDLTAEVLDFTRERKLAPYSDGECIVGPAPESRSWAMAMMSWSGPYEKDTASYYYVTPPNAAWPAEEQEQWLQVFSATSLPAITAHEVAPGHYSHGRALRRAPSEVRRTLMSGTFAEGWAHYVEEVMVEEGFRAEDPRFAIGVWLEALIRVIRLRCSLGLHAGGMSVDEATREFEQHAFLGHSAARGEAQRGTFDVGYGRYTWGKLAVQDLRDKAKNRWGSGFSLERFHTSMLTLGSPPIGLLENALEVPRGR